MRGSAMRLLALLGVAATLVACHREVESVPLVSAAITPRDRFLDVSTRDGLRVDVVGAFGKHLRSDDGGVHWRVVPTGVERGLNRIRWVDPERGWIVGQAGLVLRSRDGGVSWESIEVGTDNHLFALALPAPGRIVAAGDRSQWVESTDDGATWSARRIARSPVGMDRNIAAAVDEPIYYDLHFEDVEGSERAWMVGDYGNIRVSDDGGATWGSQHGSLLGQRAPGAIKAFRNALDLPALFRVAMVPGGLGWVTGVGGFLARTDDAGENWRVLETGLPPTEAPPLLELVLGGRTPLVLGGSGFALAEATSTQWRRFDLGLSLRTWASAASFASEGPLAGVRGFLVGGRGLVARTDDGGASWRLLGPAGAAS